ncbi:phage tail protein [Paenibacillus silviterrae]|uniref:phage tail protein n=1 Tax=Paenibacillus silviterrae TaxID=3242194 RepID=UPI0025434072|nr:phage tail protein [Paenibacillus chinjuensis]
MMEPFRFFSLNKPSDWQQGITDNIDIDSALGMGLAKTKKYNVTQHLDLAELEGIPEIIDVALGRQGRLYLMDEDAALWIFDTDNLHLEPLIARNHGIYTPGARITAWGDLVLIIDAAAEESITAYSASNGQAVWSHTVHRGKRIYPILAVSDTEDGFVVLTALEGESGYRLLRYHRSGRLIDERDIRPGKIEGLESWPGSEEEWPAFLDLMRRQISMTSAPDGTVWLLQPAEGRLYQYPADGLAPIEQSYKLQNQHQVQVIAADRQGKLFAAARSIGSDLDMSGSERESFLYSRSHPGEAALPAFERLSSFPGACDRLFIDEKGILYALHLQNTSLLILRSQQRTRLHPRTGFYSGTWISASLDSYENELEWHKLSLDATIGEGMQLRVSWYASDRKTVMLGDSTYIDIDELLADPDRTAEEKQRLLLPLWSAPMDNPKDALFFGAKGRYLWIRLELVGSEQGTPALKRLRVYYPRMSYLSYLPAVYQHDEKSRSFLERYLSLYASMMEETDERIATISRYFDPDALDGPYLRWLAGWLGLAAEDYISDQTLKLLMREASFLYRHRGTRAALERIIEIFTGEKPIIVEHHQIRHLLENAEQRERIAELYGDDPYTFCVMVQPEHAQTDKQRYLLEKLIHEQKPAYTEAKLIVLQPWMNMDMHTYLGINTKLSEPTLLTLNQQATLPHHSVLIDVDRDRRMDIHTRLGLDSELE